MPSTSTLSPAATELQQPIDTEKDNNPVRINSRSYQQASGSSIGFQSKPSQDRASTGTVTGGEISPRVASGIAVANVKGLHVDALLKGTVAGAISGNVNALELELTTDDAGVRVIFGWASLIRLRTAFSAAITGLFSAIRIEKNEAQTGSANYDAVLELTGTYGANSIWDDADTNTAGTKRGAIKVNVNGADRWIRLYDSGV
jgi:hypothetical protein